MSTPHERPRKLDKPRKPLPRVHAGGKRKRTVARIRKVKASRKSCLALVQSFWRRRDGVCQAIGAPIGKKIHSQCSGSLQGAHAFSKKSYPAVMFEPWAGMALCAGAHWDFHQHEACWEMFLRKRWGDECYEERWRLANCTVKHDLVAVETELYRQIGLLG